MELNLLIDSNVILDAILEREPFFDNSNRVVNLSQEYPVNTFVSAASVTDVYYIAYRQIRSREAITSILNKLLQTMKIAPVTHKEIIMALNLNRKDFEDSVQYCVAATNGFDGIVTRNMTGFDGSEVKIFTPEEACRYVEETFKE